MEPRRDLEKFIDETRDAQRNIVFPDTVRNARSVDAFLWKGSPSPTLVQRIAAWMIGLTFIVAGVTLLPLAAQFRDQTSWIAGLIDAMVNLLIILGGIRIFRNGFPRRP